jgi:hypothetical protein
MSAVARVACAREFAGASPADQKEQSNESGKGKYSAGHPDDRAQGDAT